MSKYKLSEDKLSEIRELSKKRLDGEERIRLACVYSVGSGKSVKWVCDHLLLQERTVFRYLADYHEKGKVGPGGDGINGRPSKLTEEESKDLKEHLRNNIYRSTKAIIQHIKAKYGVSYSEGGLAKWLSKAGFRYKRPKLVPYTVSAEKQKEFIEIYNKMKAEKKEEEVILFMDGVHPNHQTQNVHGWIERSKLAQVASTGKQPRVHYMGAVEIQEDKVTHFVKQYETINSASVKEFLSSLMEKYTGKKLKIICDQGAYHKSKETKEFINMNNEKIELIYLPPRCPNLNVIERLWKVMRENVTYNKYYHKFKDFAQAVDDFFSSKIYELQHLLVTRLQDNFHIILPNFLTNFS